MISFLCFEVDDGFGYEVLDNEVAFLVQEFHPSLPGFQRMTIEEANTLARERAEYFQALLYPITEEQ